MLSVVSKVNNVLKLGNRTAKTNSEKVQLFAESVERNFGIESHLFRKSDFDRIDKFVEAWQLGHQINPTFNCALILDLIKP